MKVTNMYCDICGKKIKKTDNERVTIEYPNFSSEYFDCHEHCVKTLMKCVDNAFRNGQSVSNQLLTQRIKEGFGLTPIIDQVDN